MLVFSRSTNGGCLENIRHFSCASHHLNSVVPDRSQRCVERALRQPRREDQDKAQCQITPKAANAVQDDLAAAKGVISPPSAAVAS